MVTGHEVYSFLDIFSSYHHHDSTRGLIQNNLHHRIKCIHMASHALRIEKLATNLLTNYKIGFQGIYWCVHEVVFR
jgi:hypothetical protein